MNLGDRMKMYERREAGRRAMPHLPLCARLDGRCFGSFTKGLRRPYDVQLSGLMVETTRHMVEETNACIGYTQSDEISLIWWTNNTKTQLFMDGRIQKLVSTLAAMASVFFNKHLGKYLPDKARQSPTFDCRVWNVPTLTEAVNMLIWRERDATKNSIIMATREVCSHKRMLGMSGAEQQEMLHASGINWNDYPAFFKRGTYVQRKYIETPFKPSELEALPPKHEAHTNPDLVVKRRVVTQINMPPIAKVANNIAVVFRGAEPRLNEFKQQSEDTEETTDGA